MKLSDGIQKAYQTKWSMFNTFTVQIILSEAMANIFGQFDDSLNLHITKITTPDFANDPIEEYIANKWVIQNGKDALYKFNIEFKDHNQNELYKKFVNMYLFTKENFFDDIKMDVIIYKDSDWLGEDSKYLMSLSGSMIESVSNLTFDNTAEGQISEFSVNFKCVSPFIDY